MAVDYVERMAEFVANNSLPKVTYPDGTLTGRFVPLSFIDHCTNKGEIIADPSIVLGGYSGIVRVEASLKPETGGKQEFGIIFSTTQVQWSGIRLMNDKSWRAENAGKALLRAEPTINSITVSKMNIEDVYFAEAGDFRLPIQRIEISIGANEIKINEISVK